VEFLWRASKHALGYGIYQAFGGHFIRSQARVLVGRRSGLATYRAIILMHVNFVFSFSVGHACACVLIARIGRRHNIVVADICIPWVCLRHRWRERRVMRTSYDCSDFQGVYRERYGHARTIVCPRGTFDTGENRDMWRSSMDFW
jgi:hypothetical protein